MQIVNVATIALAAIIAASQTPTAKPNDTLTWDYAVADQVAGPVTMWLVCVDGQPTSSCSNVPESSGVASAVAGERTYSWKVPALTPGAHSVSVQACTAGAAACSSGAVLAFTVQLVIANPKNLRFTKAGA